VNYAKPYPDVLPAAASCDQAWEHMLRRLIEVADTIATSDKLKTE